MPRPSNRLESNRLRWQFTLILSITVGVGIALGRLLLELGWTSLVIRNAVVFPSAYIAFFVCIYFWRKKTNHLRATTGNNDAGNATSSSREDIQPFQPIRPDRKKRSWLDSIDVGFADLGEATFILVAVIVIIWVIVWIFGEAPAIMAEGFFDVGLTASLAGALRKHRGSPWYAGLFRKTIVAFLAFYISSELLLLFAHKTCPNQPTLAKVVRVCWM